jgi:hypothetical protein
MNWKKRVISDDIISYEKEKKNIRVVIEARPNNDNSWDIFKIYNYQAKNYIEEYTASDRDSAEKMIRKLKAEKDLTPKQISDISKIRKDINIKVKREYKTDFVEKWLFRIENETVENFFVIYHEMETILDIVLNEKYKLLEKEIVKEITNILNLDMFDGDCEKRVYYFTKKNEYHEKAAKDNIILGQISYDFEDH